MLAQHSGVVIGVDTHKHTHTAAAVAPTGAVLDWLTVPANPKGYRQLLAFGRHHDSRMWAIEGTGSFGAGLTTALLAEHERVVEVDRPQRPALRAGAKSDDIDAVRAARQALAGVGLGEPRWRGEREAIRVWLATRAQAVEFRSRAVLALHALVTTAPDPSGSDSGRCRSGRCSTPAPPSVARRDSRPRGSRRRWRCERRPVER